MTTFETLSTTLQTAIKRLGITEPTQIQRDAIPHIIQGKDVIGESATGSGKTLAFGSGIIENVLPNGKLQALVLTPTRELAEQVKDSLVKLSFQKKLRITAVYGGVSLDPQVHELSKAQVAVATPGRLLDHMQRGTVNLSNMKILVLDEADRMFDMGFIDDVERIISVCPKNRQSLFFSATISQNVRDLAHKHMRNPIQVSAENQVDPSKLKQVYYDVPRNMKLSLLVHLFQEERKGGLAMVFCNTRRSTDFITQNLKTNGIKATAIHGGLSQNKRLKTIKMFDDGKMGVLVCTDVAARGLHIDDVSHVYNFEIPNDPTDYVHRIGRTARAGEAGKVVNFISDHDHAGFARVLDENRKFNIENVERPYVKRITMTVSPERRQGSGYSRNGHSRNGSPRRNMSSRGEYISGGRSQRRDSSRSGSSWQRPSGRREYSR